MISDRRSRRREAGYLQRRRYPRLKLDVDWFVESDACSTLGRGLEISPRGALLPVTCLGELSTEAKLFVALPGRARMFKAEALAIARPGKGWVIQFCKVSEEDLNLLAQALIDQYGLTALPNLERKFSRYASLDPRLFKGEAAQPGDWL